jgi:class 3 adenylate cyclase
MERPQTRYVDVGGAEVAYQVVGQGPPDVVHLTGLGNIDVRWEDPVFAGFLERLASFSRLILFDRRGTGVSDAVPDTAMPTWEEWVDDLRAVLDAARSERTVVLAESDGGRTGLLFTAMQPERVSALILANTTARRLGGGDYPMGVAPEAVQDRVEMWRAVWGTPDVVPMIFDGAKFVELPGGDFSVAFSTPAVEEIVEFLTGERPPVEVDRILTTLLFTDIVGSTERAVSLGDQRWHSVLDAHDGAVRDQLRRFRGKEINTTGDGFLASFDGPARAIRCALAITDVTMALGLDLHIGLHTSECEVRGDDLGGLRVHIASRICSLAPPGEVLVSSTVKDLVAGSNIEFAERGEHQLKGVPGSWQLYRAVS